MIKHFQNTRHQKVLVTGGAGYVGSVLCEHLLEAGYEVVVIDNLIHQQNSLFHLCIYEHFDFVKGDVRDEYLMRRLIKNADVLIPLAAVVGAPACDQDPWLAKSLNVGAIQLLNRLRGRNQLVIYPTTNSGYGTKSGDIYCTEDTPLDPISLYGQTKAKAEAELLATPNVITLRLATVFGISPRMRIDLLVNHFVYVAVKEGYIVIFEKDFKRNYVHIRDVAECFIHCITHAEQMAGRPYNVGLDAANLSKEELALKIKVHVPNLYIHFSEVGSDPDKRNYIVSNQRLREAGFEARRSIDDGIKELLKGYRMMGRTQFKNV
jgi:nucleoside-diphosphate-sugar epimerase